MQIVQPSYNIIAASNQTDLPYSYSRPLELIERCGRLCYKSEDKIGPGTAEKFVNMLRSKKHMAMIEHSWKVTISDEFLITEQKFLNAIYPDSESIVLAGNVRAWEESDLLSQYKFSDIDESGAEALAEAFMAPWLLSATVHFICDRGVTHALVRHRPASYAQESTRWCNYGSKGISIIMAPGISWWQAFRRKVLFWLIEKLYNKEIKEGIKPQIARGVLPTALKTEIIVTADLREWQWIFHMRDAVDAHPQMVELMSPLHEEFARRWPVFFGREAVV